MSELPVSVKAALRSGDRWVLLRNDRDEWELPGGRIDATDSTPAAALRRECREELGLDVQVGELVDCWIFEVVPGRRVLIVCYAAVVAGDVRPVISDEHNAVGLFETADLAPLALPEGYRNAIHLAAK